jgi:hypothetical protein
VLLAEVIVTLPWRDGKGVGCMEMEMEAVMTPHKQVFNGMQKRQRNQISPLSSRNLQSPFPHAGCIIHSPPPLSPLLPVFTYTNFPAFSDH